MRKLLHAELTLDLLYIDRTGCCFPLSSSPPSHTPPAPSQAPVKIMWNTSNSKVILRWDQVHALENESEVTGYKVRRKECTFGEFYIPLEDCMDCTGESACIFMISKWFYRLQCNREWLYRDLQPWETVSLSTYFVRVCWTFLPVLPALLFVWTHCFCHLSKHASEPSDN